MAETPVPTASFSEYLKDGKNRLESHIAVSLACGLAALLITETIASEFLGLHVSGSVPMECVSGVAEVIPRKDGNLLYFKDANRIVIMPNDIMGKKTGDYVSVVAERRENKLYGMGYISSCPDGRTAK
jgi:hypothetical protein